MEANIPEFCVVAAVDEAGGIGRAGALPWGRAELPAFREFTSCRSPGGGPNALVMGRATWESIGGGPLPGREAVVVSRSLAEAPPGARLARSLPEALAVAGGLGGRVFVVGGAAVFEEALRLPQCASVRLTRVPGAHGCDRSFPPLSALAFAPCGAGPAGPWRAEEFVRRRGGCKNAEEGQYLQLVRRALDFGRFKPDRTGTGVFSVAGAQMRFSLRGERFPLLTTKRVWFRGVLEELLWIVRGCTDARQLSARGVRIWEANSSRAFLDAAGLAGLREGDIGPGYGFQLRHFGGEYRGCEADHAGEGVDQLAALVRGLRADPFSRRHVVSLWHAAAAPRTAVPPCHVLTHWLAQPGPHGWPELVCHLFQRSGDLGLGVPFNIASYALLARMVAQAAGLRAGELVHTVSDAHVYANHAAALAEQLAREPRAFPRLRLDPGVREVWDFRPEHFTLEGYAPHPPLGMEMAV